MNMNVSMYIDYYDLIWKSERLFDQEMIDQFLGRCAESGIKSVYWRVSALGLLVYHSRTADRLDRAPVDIKFDNLRKNIYEKTCAILSKFDPMAVAVELAHKHGLTISPWLTLYDDYGLKGNFPSELQRTHPECYWKHIDSDEYLPGVTSYVHQRSVEYRMRQIQELLAYDVDGLLLSVGSHSRVPKAVSVLREWLADNPGKDGRDFDIAHPGLRTQIHQDACGKYGFDKPAVDAFMNAYNCKPESDDETWWTFRGSYLHNFLKKVRNEMDKENQLLAIYYRQPQCQQNRLIPESFFRWEDMIQSKIVDEIHYLMPDGLSDITNSFPELKKKENSWAHAVLWLGEHNYKNNLTRCEVLEHCLSEYGFAGVSFFEAMSFFMHPDNWNYVARFANQYKS